MDQPRQCNGADPLARPREWIAAAVLYLVLTFGFLWFAVSPLTMATRVQTRDSILIAAIMRHTLVAPLLDDVSFWQFGIFHPFEDTLCLSEPMIAGAILTAPVSAIWGYAAAHNFLIYLSWLGGALAAWAYLRHRDVCFLAALWGGFFVTFNPDRSWHVAGHAHLFFQVGFPLALLAVERALRINASRWWGALFAAAFFFQILSGFYLTVLFGLWLLFMLPASVVSATEGRIKRVMEGLRRHGPIMATGMLLTVAVLLPIAVHYSHFGRGFPQNPLETVAHGDATWRGYLLPPADPERILTPPGWLYTKLRGPAARGEDTQYTGLVVLLLLGGGAIAILRMRKQAPWPRAQTFYITMLAAVGLVALALSFGAYRAGGFGNSPRLPFAYLYAWFEPLRFFRGPSRFAFVVFWAGGFLGAFALSMLMQRLKAAGRPRAAIGLGLGAIVLTAVEFFPLTAIYRVWVPEDDFSRHLLIAENRQPFVELPVDTNQFMARLGWHQVPVANGFSGYEVGIRRQELMYFDRHFPSPESLMLLSRWDMRRVFVSRYAPPEHAERCREGGFRQIWTGQEGTLFELIEQPFSYEGYLARRREARPPTIDDYHPLPFFLMREGTLTPEAQEAGVRLDIHAADTLPSGEFVFRGPLNIVEFDLPPEGLDPVRYTSLTLRLCVENWYDLKEGGRLYWATELQPEFSEERSQPLLIPADGLLHAIDVSLGEHIVWITGDAVRRVRFDLGGRAGNRVFVDHLAFE